MSLFQRYHIYKVQKVLSLNYNKYFVEGNEQRTKLSEFNSNNTQLLNVEQVKEKLLQLDYIKNELKNLNTGNAVTRGNELFGSN